MTITDYHLFHGDDPRRIDASCVYELLRHDGVTDVRYDGNLVVTAGPVTVSFDYHQATIAFVDRWCHSLDCCVVTLIPSCATYGTVADIVAALATHLAVRS
jgi:hypothetical protein